MTWHKMLLSKSENIKLHERFAIQIDESVDISDEAELLVYIRYFDVKKGATADEILGCKQTPEHTRGVGIFKILEFHNIGIRFPVGMVCLCIH